MRKKVVILGGGVSGLYAAWKLSEQGFDVTLLEKAAQVGGAAATVTIPEDRVVPAGYHQIVGSDHFLLTVLQELDILKTVHWKKTRIEAAIDGDFLELASLPDIARLRRLTPQGKLQYLFFGARCLLTKNWESWQGKSVSEWVTAWAGREVLEEIFKPLIEIKFGFSPDEANAAWLGSRLSHREGNVPFGYVPHRSWTKDLCDALIRKIEVNGGRIHTSTTVTQLVEKKQSIIHTVKTDVHGDFPCDILLSTLPPPVLTPFLENTSLSTREIDRIRYISTYSLLAGVSEIPFEEYWTIALHPRRVFGGCFTISLLNDTLATAKDAAVINLFTNVTFGHKPWSKDEYIEKAYADLSEMSRKKIIPNWTKLTYIQTVSPVFDVSYSNPPARLGSNMYLAGIYRTYPKLSSTGEAMLNAHEVVEKIGADYLA